jgi:hypothetical protein
MFRFLTICLVITVLFLAIGSVLAIYNPASEAYIHNVLAQKAQALPTANFTFAELESGFAIWKYEQDLRQAAFAEGGQIILLLVISGLVICTITGVLLTMRWQTMEKRLNQVLLEIEIEKTDFQQWHGQAIIQKSLGRLDHFYSVHPAQRPGDPNYPSYHNPSRHFLNNRGAANRNTGSRPQ